MSAEFPKSAGSANTGSSASAGSESASATSSTTTGASAVAATADKAPRDDDKRINPLSAAQRLAESRERLRQYMLRGNGRHEARRRTAAAQAEGSRASAIDRLRALPVVGVVIDAVSAWWSNHPLHPAATVVENVARDTVAPFTRRHPIPVLISAFFVGGAIVWFKPWRLAAKSALFGGLISQVASHAITQMPWESLLGAFTSFARSISGPESEAASSPDEQNPPANEASARVYQFEEAA